MAIKTILSVIGSEGAHEDLSAAIDAATEVGAYLVAFAAGIAEPPTVGDHPFGIGWIERRDDASRQLEQIRSGVVQQCQSAGLPYQVEVVFSERASLEHTLFRKALHSDLAIMGRGRPDLANLRRTVVDAVTFQAGRPLLLASNDGDVTLKPKRVLLAWDFKPGAAHAASATMDMLANAEAVHLVIVDLNALDGGAGEDGGADAAAYLARHGVNVVVERLSSDGLPAETVLLQRASEIGADLMVMGAYGHSRMRQRIFGGVTASILQGASLPVLMAH